MAINCAVLSLLFGANRGWCAGIAAGGNLLLYFRWAGNGFRARVHASHYREKGEGYPECMPCTKQLTLMLNTMQLAESCTAAPKKKKKREQISAINCVHAHDLPDHAL